MRRCGKCAKVKPADEFHRSRKRGSQSWCKACRKLYDAAYYRRHHELRKQQRKQRRADFRAWYISLKEGKPCSDCGIVLPPPAMHWDHIPGCKKVDDLGNLGRRSNRAKVLAEIAKCQLVCANCHALRTLLRRGA